MLQLLSTDISTTCHLGVCIAIRLNEAIPLLNADCDVKFSVSNIESALRKSGLGKRSKQRFLKPSSSDNFIKAPRKGSGGNTVPYKCFIIKQSAVSCDIVELLRKGTYL